MSNSKGSLRPLPPPPLAKKKRFITREQKLERSEAFEYFLLRGRQDSFLVKMGAEQYSMGPKAVRRLIDEIQERWSREDTRTLHGAERNRDIIYLNEMLRKLTHYPAGTARPNAKGELEDLSGQEITDPKDIPFQTVLAVVRERANLWRKRGEGKQVPSNPLFGAEELVEVEGEEEETVHGD